MKSSLFMSITVLFSLTCCKQVPPKKLSYIYTAHDEQGNGSDSLKTYAKLPFEASLELYTDTDTLNKTVQMLVHLGIFKLQGQRFAVITDTSGTAFFKFEKGRYNKIFSDEPSISFDIDPMKYADYNNDGYTDVFYSVASGGSYGSDDYILFFDPKKKTLIYNAEPALRNAVIKNGIVKCSGAMWSNEYVIDGTKLWLYKERSMVQNDTAHVQEAVTTYNKKGAVVTQDTVIVAEVK